MVTSPHLCISLHPIQRVDLRSCLVNGITPVDFSILSDSLRCLYFGLSEYPSELSKYPLELAWLPCLAFRIENVRQMQLVRLYSSHLVDLATGQILFGPLLPLLPGLQDNVPHFCRKKMKLLTSQVGISLQLPDISDTWMRKPASPWTPSASQSLVYDHMLTTLENLADELTDCNLEDTDLDFAGRVDDLTASLALCRLSADLDYVL